MVVATVTMDDIHTVDETHFVALLIYNSVFVQRQMMALECLLEFSVVILWNLSSCLCLCPCERNVAPHIH